MKLSLTLVTALLAAGAAAKRVNHGFEKHRVVHEFDKRVGEKREARVVHSFDKREANAEPEPEPEPLERRERDAVVAMEFNVKRSVPAGVTPSRGRIQRRDGGMTEVELRNEQRLVYLSEIQIGTPGQTLEIVLDTGSSDLWVMDTENPYCTEDEYDIMLGEGVNCTGIVFDHSSSSTWSFNDSAPDFEIMYGDGSAAIGKWGRDTVQIGDISISNANMALGEESNSTACVFGIGLITNEAIIEWRDWLRGSSSQWPPEGTYDNVPVQMKQQGAINRVAYSFWLNEGAENGVALFGGVDHSKYDGTLQRLPVVTSLDYEEYNFGGPLELNVVLNSITGKNTDGDTVEFMSDASTAALIDTGTSFQYLPYYVADAIATSLDAYSFSDGYGWYTDCGMANAGSVVYNFCGVEVEVPLSEMLIELVDEDDEPIVEDGVAYCQLAIMPDSDMIILGDSFMRAAYVVFDLEANEIAFAQAKTGSDAGDSNIQVMSDGIPSASAAPSYSSTSLHSSYNYDYSRIFTASGGLAGSTASVTGSVDSTASITRPSATRAVTSDELSATNTRSSSATSSPSATSTGGARTSSSASSAAAASSTESTDGAPALGLSSAAVLLAGAFALLF